MPSKKEYAKDKDRYRKESLKYYMTHRKERDGVNKIWGKDNPEKLKSIRAKYRNKNKEKLSKYNNAYNKIHKVERNECKKIWRKNNKEKEMDMRLNQYNITYKDYIKILQNQNNKCGVCNTEFKNYYKCPDLRSPCIDHSHSYGKEVRGILCRGCNSGMGLFDDNPYLLKAALCWLAKKEYNVFFNKNWYCKKETKEPVYRKIFNDQDGKCGICQRDLLIIRTNLDHNHFSSKIRGLLCAKCNKALGFLKDDLSIIKNSMKWLKKK